MNNDRRCHLLVLWDSALAEWRQAGEPAHRYPEDFTTPAVGNWYGEWYRAVGSDSVVGPMRVAWGH